MSARNLLGRADVSRILKRLAHEIIESGKGVENLTLVGIRSGGDILGRELKAQIQQIEGVDVPFGLLDTTLYRDDLDHRNDHPEVKVTDIPFDMAGKDVLLVDDVLYTGRTIRAALNALMDFGRPARVMLAVLIDRGHRELPIRADFVGKNIPTEASETVALKIAEDGSVDGVELYPKEAS
ncbi:MAG: bifunctional pyr operon transcriptional regulator/uracil phosphoribosyltransferase PyrR [Leptospirillia bacterium]